MFFSYAASVTLLSFAIFGLWCFGRELWVWLVEPYLYRTPKISFLVLVKDIEQDIEEMLRHLMLEIETSDRECQVVVMDCGSEDLTYAITQRLSREFHSIISICPQNAPNGVSDALPYCGGSVVHLLDTVHRMEPANFISVVCWLMKESAKQKVD